jgi:DNA-binding transcriptional LysR family regulator
VQILLSHTKPTDKPSHLLFPISYVPAGNQHWFQQMQLQDNPLAALEDAVLIVHQARPWAWHQWADQAGFEDFRPKQIIQLDSMFSVARAAQQGLGIALIPLPISQNWFDNASLYRLSAIELTTRDHYYLVQHDSTTSRTEVQLLVEWVLEKFRAHR